MNVLGARIRIEISQKMIFILGLLSVLMEFLKVEGRKERWTTGPGIKPAGRDEELLLRLRCSICFFSCVRMYQR